jgi:hypothetical protein
VGIAGASKISKLYPKRLLLPSPNAGHSSRHSRWARYDYLEPVGAGLRCVRLSRVHVEEKAAPFLRGLSFGQVLLGI